MRMSGLTDVQQEFIDFAVKEGALKFGEFTLKSGRKSPFFFNMGDFSLGYQLLTIAGIYGDVIYQKVEDGEIENFNILFGPAYKGIPLAACVAMYLSEEYDVEVSYCANRKEAKNHGDVGALLGSKLKDGDHVLIIEDVMTSGKSIEEVVPIIKAQGDVKIVGEIIALDRCERADGTTESATSVISKKHGFPITSVVQMDKVIKYLRENTDVITDSIHKQLQDYYATYGADCPS